jgi:hypothetical protein
MEGLDLFEQIYNQNLSGGARYVRYNEAANRMNRALEMQDIIFVDPLPIEVD